MSYLRSRTLGRYGKAQPPTVTPFTFPASVGGVNAVDSLMNMPPTDCIYTFNLMPSEYGMRLRKGYREWATNCIEDPPRAADASVKSVIPFESSQQTAANDRLFVVTSEGIWDTTLFNTIAPVQVVTFLETGPRSGYGVWTEFTGDAAGDGLRGHYMFYADGLNGIWQYEEATGLWTQPVSGTLDTDWYYLDVDGTTKIPFPVDDVAFVMVHKQRIWVILENEDDAWYLPVASVTGKLTKFTFGSKLPHGGNLLGLYNWTVDGGDGVDDMLVAVSRGGDVIIYQGEDPEITPDGSSQGPWSTRGAWYVGEMPDSRRVVTAYGPDLFILSTFGVSSLNDLLRGAPLGNNNTPSRNVNRFLRADVENGKDSNTWQMAIHPADGFLQIITPKPSQTPNVQYNMNLQTSAWGFWENVPIFCGASWNGEYFMGGADGIVYINDGTLDGTQIAKENFFQDAPTGVVPPEWTVPVPDEFVCDGSQVAATQYEVDMLEPLTTGEPYIVFYRVKDSTAGRHQLLVDSVPVSLERTGDGAFAGTFVAASDSPTMALAGDADFAGTFYDVALRVESFIGEPIKFRSLTSFQAPKGHSNFNRVGFIRTIGVLAGTSAINVKAVYDYSIEAEVEAPIALPQDGQNVWDSALWDLDLWDYDLRGKSFPYGALGMGRTFAVAMNGNANTRINVVGWDTLFTTGGFL